MEPNEKQQTILNIINRAESRQFTEFRFLVSWEDYKNCQQAITSTNLTIRILQKSAAKLFKSYCKEITAGTTDINKLLAFTQLCEISDFYEKDLKIINSMICEYEDYLAQGNFWYSFLGGKRDL